MNMSCSSCQTSSVSPTLGNEYVSRKRSMPTNDDVSNMIRVNDQHMSIQQRVSEYIAQQKHNDIEDIDKELIFNNIDKSPLRYYIDNICDRLLTEIDLQKSNNKKRAESISTYTQYNSFSYFDTCSYDIPTYYSDNVSSCSLTDGYCSTSCRPN